ncbi:MAG: hypothetical protein HY899_17760 [Deltaproteobacteria bacterium]|nr:hypothetical protein [Deltaproteobacteria bacterium]
MLHKKSFALMCAVGLATLALGMSQAQAAGNVVASVNQGVLHVTGDGSDNSIVMDPAMDGLNVIPSVFVLSSGDGTTTINGVLTPYTTATVNKEVLIDLGEGADDLAMNNVTITRMCRITTGNGDSSVTMDNVVMNKQVRLTMGDGNNVVDINNTDISEPSKIITGNGPDSITFSDVEFRGGITTKQGDDTLVIDGSHHVDPRGKLAIKTANGLDNVTFTNASWQGKVLINTGHDDDTVTAGNIHVGVFAKITGSADTDTLTNNGGHDCLNPGCPSPEFLAFP